MGSVPFTVIGVVALIVILTILAVLMKSFHSIGPTQIGLVTKSFGAKLPDGKLIAENGEAGYQPDLLMPGWRFKPWPMYKVSLEERVQIPAGSIGVVIAQIGAPLPTGAKTAAYKSELGDFSNLQAFLQNGGQGGVQRPVLAQGTTHILHPIAFVVVTQGKIYGRPLSASIMDLAQGLGEDKLSVTKIGTTRSDSGQSNNFGSRTADTIGIVTALEGPPLPSGDIAGRIGGYDDVLALEKAEDADVNDVIQLLMGTKNGQHNNYQDFQAFLDAGGCIGLQQDPLLYGEYNLNPFCVSVEIVPMLVVEQGEVAVIKSYVGLPTEDTSGSEYKFGAIVRPGHRGVWAEPLRTGKYPLNPRCYEPETVPTSILTLNWATATSEAHDLDKRLSSIDAKSKDAFAFKIDLQVLIHVPDTKAPQVIGMVGTMQNLVNEVLQSAVGNYVRSSLQGLTAIDFIQTRQSVQETVETDVTAYLGRYNVEVRGVYIQDVVYPKDLVDVLTTREIAIQEKTTFASQQDAQAARVTLERQRGVADAQASLAKSEVSIDIKRNDAQASIEEAKGTAEVTRSLASADAERIKVTGDAEASATEAKGKATAAAYEAQKNAIGADQTALVAVLHEIGEGSINVTPQIVVGSDNGSIGGLLTTFLTNTVARQVTSPSDDGQLATSSSSDN